MRRIAIIAATLAFVAMLAGCGTQQGTQQESQPASQAMQTLDMGNWTVDVPDSWGELKPIEVEGVDMGQSYYVGESQGSPNATFAIYETGSFNDTTASFGEPSSNKFGSTTASNVKEFDVDGHQAIGGLISFTASDTAKADSPNIKDETYYSCYVDLSGGEYASIGIYSDDMALIDQIIESINIK